MAERNSAKRQSSSGRSDSKVGSVISIVFISVLAVVMLGAVIISLDKRNTMYSQVAALREQLEITQAENVRLQTELESKISAKNVEDYAENVLGMKKIDASQIKYIQIQTDDVVSIPEHDEGLMSKIKKFFNRCVEYFRG